MTVIPLQSQRNGNVGEANAKWPQLGIQPRKWQAAALPTAMKAIQEQWQSSFDDEQVVRPIVQAVMGAGKSIFIAGVVGAALDLCDDVIVVTAPRKMLVRQLADTLGEYFPQGSVGRYYGAIKQPGRRVIVACDASVPRLAKTLESAGRKVGLWIADECHGSESDRIKDWCENTKPRARLGLTATPRRADDDEVLSLWNKEIHRYDASQAMADGVVVPFVLRHWRGPGCEISDACLEMIKTIVAEKVGPGVTDASSIIDAEAFVAELIEHGIKATTIHSRLKQSLVQERLTQLHDGEVDVVVHVSMLKEGVDLPWLRWLCLRRQVESKVYFAQHVGRGLRSHPGKDEAIILDPGNLFEKHKINLEAILEMDVSDEEQDNLPIPAEEPDDKDDLDIDDAEVAPKYAVPMNRDTSTLQSIFVEMETKGQVKRGVGGAWRDREISEKQLAIIEKSVTRRYTKAALQRHHYVGMFRRLYAQRRALSRGQASDYISVIFGLTESFQQSFGGAR